ncbi:hypothetical protein [Arthrobacter sunyaminii]|uniref:hypothetical protein n=1 Tax=Arthrobacter sunyaminii TaxID=2816859 RepID=UPI001A93DB51|nr:hypothetical protein [Arthrobacter sunyaminii]MBO0896524.1 hypothetical protein [Arthrobacter sunyaminii]
MTVISGAWLILAVTGFGFFSGGTTSLAFSLILMYATGAALIIVIAAIYRAVKNSAIRRSETAPEDTAALAFIDTTRSAADELLAALRPAPPTGRAYDPAARTVGPAVSMIEAVAAARAAANAAAVALTSTPAEANRTDRPAKKDQAPAAKTAAAAPVAKPAAAKKPSAAKSAVKTPAAKPAAAKKPSAKTAAKPSAVKNTAGKVPGKTPAGSRTPAKTPAKGAVKGAGKGSGNGAAKKQQPRSGAVQPKKKTAPGVSANAASPACASPAMGQRPALVLASSNPVPQAVRKVHEALTRQKAS